MSGHVEDPSPPRGLLLGIGVLISATLLLVALARSHGVGLMMTRDIEPAASAATAVREAALRFADRDDGAVVVTRAVDGATVAVIESGSGGFVRGVMRGLARERRMHGIESTPPFLLTQWSDGRLTLRDTATDRLIDLGAFGQTNLGAFAALLPRDTEARR
jgi:putative photosynthetic complex assembly protein